MPDVKEVIKGLEMMLEESKYNDSVQYNPWADTETLEAALALLKAQEAVEPTEPDEDNMVYCGACGTPVGYEVLEPPGMDYIRYNYCPKCGQAVKWDG